MLARDAKEWHGRQEYKAERNGEPTLKYCRENFRFALLEYLASRTLDEIILARERFWNKILLTHGEYALNRN